jgi:hypothetical protein
MELNIVVEGNDTPEERAIILPIFNNMVKTLLNNDAVEPWMTVVILANVLTACIMQMADKDQPFMLEYFNETLQLAWDSNAQLAVLVKQPRTGRPN